MEAANKAPYPDRDGEQRAEDSLLLGRVNQDLLHWWNERLSLIGKVVVLLGGLSSAFGLTYSAAAGVEAIRSNFGDLPERVENLEGWQETHVSDVSDPRGEQVDENTALLDTIRGTLDRAVEGGNARDRRLVRLEGKLDRVLCYVEADSGLRPFSECVR